jgi:ribosome-binding protein aMBF1 (putative translation factor)
MSKHNQLPCIYCGTMVQVGDDVESVWCWECSLRKSAQAEHRHLKPLAYHRSPDQVVEALHKGKIRDMRIELGYSQEEMARMVGISQPQYARYERLTIPVGRTLKRIENYLNKQYYEYGQKTHRNGLQTPKEL